MKEQSSQPEPGIIQKFIRAALTKFMSFWKQGTVHTGIQFYTEMDD